MFKNVLTLTLVGLFLSSINVNSAHAKFKKDNLVNGRSSIEQLQSVATEDEAREVNKVVTEFMKRVQESRDFASARELYLNDFIKRQVDADRDYIFPERLTASLPFGPHNSLYMSLWPQISAKDWERLYFSYQNLMYLRVLYIVANNSFPYYANPSQQDYPPEIGILLKSNKVLIESQTINKISDFRSVCDTLEKATAVMREYFKNNPPEQTKLYKEALKNYTVEQRQYSAGAHVYVAPEVRYGFPRRTRFFTLLTKPQLFEMTLVRVSEGMKIVWVRVYPFN